MLHAADLTATEASYRRLGPDLAPEQHDGGPVHSVTTLGDVHLAICQAEPNERSARPAWQQAGSSLPGVWVTDVADTVDGLRSDGHPSLLGHERRSWGCRVVVEDPDGSPIEVDQRGHCGG